jgi:hypothetical protein
METCYNSIRIPVPVEDVWNAIRDFHNLSWAGEAITKVTAIGAVKGDQVGAKRVLNDTFEETLLSLDDGDHKFSYSIDDAPGTPVSRENVRNYVGEVRLAPITEDNSTFVEWRSSCDATDAAAVSNFCNPIYGAALRSLKKRFS